MASLSRSSRNALVVGIAALALGALLYAGSRPSEPSAGAAIEGGAAYLARMTNDNGSFVYEFDPETGKRSSAYNILRHAGTAYALLEAYEATGDQGALQAAEAALRYLAAQAVPCPAVESAECIAEDGEIKLGGNALAVLAFAKHRSVTGSDAYLSKAQALASYLTETQSPQGEFTAHKTDAAGTIDPFKSEYYPGEALFALARLSKEDGNPAWMTAAHQGARWLIEVRDAGKTAAQLPHDHWLLYALNELHADTPDARYVDHARKLTDAIVAAQHRGLSGERAAWNGGYYDPPRSTPTATRSEGLSAAYRLFTRAGAEEDAARALEGVAQGIRFQLRTYITPADVRSLGYHRLAHGGFCESLQECRVRIDYVQHNISALIAYEAILSERMSGR